MSGAKKTFPPAEPKLPAGQAPVRGARPTRAEIEAAAKRLAELIAQKPDKAAKLLSDWIARDRRKKAG